MKTRMSLKLALMFSAAGEYSAQIVGFVTIMILARLLTPTEVGVYAIAVTALILTAELRSFGVVQYLVREKEIHENKKRAVLGTAIIVSWGLAFLLISSSSYIGAFYDAPEIRDILLILSISFFLEPFISVPFALWKREMQFDRIAVMNVGGALADSISSISLVLFGFSYYGLAIGAVIGTIARLLIAIFSQPTGTVWIPKFTLLGSLLKFGFFASLANIFTRINQSIPDLVIGKVATMGDVGFFSRGFGAVLFLHKILYSAVAPVVLPHYAEVKRSGGSVVEAYLRSAKLLSVFTLPALAVASAASYPMIIGLFGDQWGTAAPIASILAAGVMLTSVHSFSASAYIVSGHEKWMFNVALIASVFRLVLVLFAAPRGIEMVAWAVVVSGAIELLVNTFALKKNIGLQANKLVIALLPSLFISTMCWLATVSIDHIIVFKQTNPLQSLALVAVSLTVLWLSLLRVTKHEAWYLIWDVLGRKKR